MLWLQHLKWKKMSWTSLLPAREGEHSCNLSNYPKFCIILKHSVVYLDSLEHLLPPAFQKKCAVWFWMPSAWSRFTRRATWWSPPKSARWCYVTSSMTLASTASTCQWPMTSAWLPPVLKSTSTLVGSSDRCTWVHQWVHVCLVLLLHNVIFVSGSGLSSPGTIAMVMGVLVLVLAVGIVAYSYK